MDKILIYIKKLIPTRVFKALQPIYHFFLSWFSALIFGFPSNKLIVVGVTGTTGKTTSVYLIAKMLEGAGLKVGFTSTAVFNNGEKEWLNDKKMTMVGRFFTQRILRQMQKNHCQVAIVETTSEGIRQFRHRFINFDILVFTGLYEEHIDSHGSFENYRNAKGELFKHLKRCRAKFVDDNWQIKKIKTNLGKIENKRIKKTVVVNRNDEHSDFFLNFWAERKIVYQRLDQEKKPKKSEWEILEYGNVKADSRGLSFEHGGLEMKMNLLGSFNADNAMNAVGVGKALDLSLEKIQAGLKEIKGVAGRLEKIDCGQNFTVIVDYAFEPKAVSKLYETLKLIEHKSIIHVLGATGGGRDVARRPILGRIAGENARLVIVTNEDPYDDDPQIIIEQVALGAEKAGKKLNENLFKICDRYQAIAKAFALAEENDIVIITGKGSEQAICGPNGEKTPWDDRAVARGILSGEDAIKI